MNERIKELKKLATEVEHSHGAFGEPEPHYRLNTEKFAELIVLECMKVAKPNYMSTPEDSVYYVEQAINRIAEHFGVK